MLYHVQPSKNTISAQVNISMVEKIAAYEQVKWLKAAVLPVLSGGAVGSKAVVQ